MERDLAGAQLTAEEFARLAVHCRNDGKFPASYEGWKEVVAVGTAQVIEEGGAVWPVQIIVTKFVEWCERIEVVPSLDAWRAYLILMRNGALDTDSTELARRRPVPPRRREGGSARYAYRVC